MNMFRANCFLLYLLLFLLLTGGISQPVLADSKVYANVAATEPAQSLPSDSEGSIKLEVDYPTLRGHSASTYEFTVKVSYTGKEAREVSLSAIAPEGFVVSIRAVGSTGGEIGSIFLRGDQAYPETIKVSVSPMLSKYAEKLPTPGKYVVTLTASSEDGKLQASVELKFEITDKYDVGLETGGALEGRLNAQVTAGRDNRFTIVVANMGTAPVEKVTFSSEEPREWKVIFEPEEIDSIGPGATREVDVNIKPPGGAVAGDYEIPMKVRVKNNLASDELKIRVTVLRPTVWGWVGVGIVLLVAAGLAGIFVRFGRR